MRTYTVPTRKGPLQIVALPWAPPQRAAGPGGVQEFDH